MKKAIVVVAMILLIGLARVGDDVATVAVKTADVMMESSLKNFDKSGIEIGKYLDYLNHSMTLYSGAKADSIIIVRYNAGTLVDIYKRVDGSLTEFNGIAAEQTGKMMVFVNGAKTAEQEIKNEEYGPEEKHTLEIGDRKDGSQFMRQGFMNERQLIYSIELEIQSEAPIAKGPTIYNFTVSSDETKKFMKKAFSQVLGNNYSFSHSLTELTIEPEIKTHCEYEDPFLRCYSSPHSGLVVAYNWD